MRWFHSRICVASEPRLTMAAVGPPPKSEEFDRNQSPPAGAPSKPAAPCCRMEALNAFTLSRVIAPAFSAKKAVRSCSQQQENFLPISKKERRKLGVSNAIIRNHEHERLVTKLSSKFPSRHGQLFQTLESPDKFDNSIG